MGAGKTTQSEKLASEESAVLISEDEWLSLLYPNQIRTFSDYRYYSSLLKPLVFSHVVNLLKTGSNVVLDFPANTVKQRQWFLELANAAGTANKLLYIKASDSTCLRHIAKRRIEQPHRADFDTEEVFAEVTRFFQEPGEDEELDIQVIEN
jgi:predicted kinase